MFYSSPVLCLLNSSSEPQIVTIRTVLDITKYPLGGKIFPGLEPVTQGLGVDMLLHPEQQLTALSPALETSFVTPQLGNTKTR
jgi:hypothetical protein